MIKFLFFYQSPEQTGVGGFCKIKKKNVEKIECNLKN